MKDISKQTLDDLITFIYSGEVNLNQNNLENFLSTAKALQIKGLIDDSYLYPFNAKASNSVWETNNGSQYQSTHTVRIQNLANVNSTPDLTDLSPHEQRSANEVHQLDTFKYENHYGRDYNCGYEMVNEGSSIDHKHNNGQDDKPGDVTDTSMNHQQNDGQRYTTGGALKPKHAKYIGNWKRPYSF